MISSIPKPLLVTARASHDCAASKLYVTPLTAGLREKTGGLGLPRSVSIPSMAKPLAAKSRPLRFVRDCHRCSAQCGSTPINACERLSLNAYQRLSTPINEISCLAPVARLTEQLANTPCFPLYDRTLITAKSSVSASMVKIQGRKVDITPSIEEFIQEKVTKALANYAEILREVNVTVSVAGNHGKKSDSAHHKRSQKAEVTVYTHRHGVVRVEDTEDDLYAAVDLVCDKMKRKMVRLKEKAVQKNTWPGRGGTKGGARIEEQVMQSALDSLDDAESVTVEDIMSDDRGDIVREKLLVIDGSMSPEEAVEGLEAVGHDFFVFMDSSDGRLKIMYRRASHGYGLIVPSPVS